jgi:uncharacterized protein
MKYLICSDIHGSFAAAQKLVKHFNELACDYMVILGDTLYFGPRNPFPEEYVPAKVAELLNSLSDKVIAVRGNCDSEVDQFVLDFPILSDYVLIIDEGRRLFITHGHVYSPEKMPKLGKNDFFFFGHTHVRTLETQNAITICNPGSASMPKDNMPPAFAIYESGQISWYDL